MALQRVLVGVLAGAIAGPMFVPIASTASTLRVYCLQAYADHVPPQMCNPSTFAFEPLAEPDTVTPLSDPMGTLNSLHRGAVLVEGNATPGSKVTVMIGDGTKTITRTAQAAPQTDPASGVRAGDFEVLFDPNDPQTGQPLTVQELGIHAAADGADPASTRDPFLLGRSELSVTAIANADGVDSAPMSVPIIKLAATPGDASPPDLLDLRFPPMHWCRYAGEGMQVSGTHPGGGADGRCSGFGPVPDVTWAACTELTRNVAGINTLQPTYCRTARGGANYPRQQAPLYGLAVDDASEIKTVTITIVRGQQTVRTYIDRFARNTSTTGTWGWSLNINDFEPSWPGPPYLITIVVEDAWGNQTEASSWPINVYPW